MKRIAIIGSTGSIGTSALKVIEANPDKYQLLALGAGKNVDLLIQQIEKFHPEMVATLDQNQAYKIRERFAGHRDVTVLTGPQGLHSVAVYPEVDTLISAISGAAGLVPTFAALETGKEVALANKETMVMAGRLMIEKARTTGGSILPVDSEHSAILQCLRGHPRADLKKILLTASGGPFLHLDLHELAEVGPEDALQHPNWRMGKKITIDSATLMNKALEAIEAKWLFDLSMDQIDIVIHPQSIVHSMVEYSDGSVIAQLGVPDMITPISYALSYPRHIPTNLPPLRLNEIGTLTFEDPDFLRFPCLALGIEAAKEGGTMPVVLNGANEMAVDAFLNRKIAFPEIPWLIEKTMAAHRTVELESIDQALEVDRWARKQAKKELLNLSS
jgi:1-deoxy-D-xylulose-5-phosphate reductoisomerase